MKSLLFLLLYLAISVLPVQAQDTLYFNWERKPIAKKKNAEYLKVITKTDTGYVVELLNKNRELESKTTYKDPDLKIREGYHVFYRGKNKDNEGRYLNGKEDGVWKYYHHGGSIAGVVVRKEGAVVSGEYFKPNGEKETDPAKIEQLPSFPGGMKALGEYVVSALRYPRQAVIDRVSGQVKVGFTVSPIGELLDITIVSGVNDELNREAMRVVRGMPRWIPGIQFNRPVRVRYTLPVNFNLNR